MAELKIALSTVCNILIAYTSVFLNLCNCHELWLLPGEVEAKGFHLCSGLRLGGHQSPPSAGHLSCCSRNHSGSCLSRTVNIPF